MKTSEINLKEDLTFDPEHGLLKYGSQRMVMFSARSLKFLMTELMDMGGICMTQVVMRLFGEAAGRDDAALLKREFHPDTDLDWIAMGPTLHTWEGVVKATATDLEYDRDSGKFMFKGTWENSYFAEQYVAEYGPQTSPVCWPLTGYATGYCSEFFGQSVQARETKCVAKGDDMCEFLVKPVADWKL